MINAIQEALAPGGANVWNNRADGLGFVTSTRECGLSDRALPEGIKHAQVIHSCFDDGGHSV